MTFELVVEPSAARDIADADAHYAQFGKADAFLSTIDNVFEHLTSRPLMYPAIHGDVRPPLLKQRVVMARSDVTQPAPRCRVYLRGRHTVGLEVIERTTNNWRARAKGRATHHRGATSLRVCAQPSAFYVRAQARALP